MNNAFGTTPTGTPAQVEEAPASDSPAAGRGGIAETIYAEVEQMTASGAMSKSDAFARISERTGRRAGTVAANYYRIARKRGEGAGPRGSRGPGRPRGRRPSGGGDVDAVITRLEEAVKDLATLVRSQEAEVTRLREQSEQFERLRRWMARNG